MKLKNISEGATSRRMKLLPQYFLNGISYAVLSHLFRLSNPNIDDTTGTANVQIAI